MPSLTAARWSRSQWWEALTLAVVEALGSGARVALSMERGIQTALIAYRAARIAEGVVSRAGNGDQTLGKSGERVDVNAAIRRSDDIVGATNDEGRLLTETYDHFKAAGGQLLRIDF